MSRKRVIQGLSVFVLTASVFIRPLPAQGRQLTCESGGEGSSSCSVGSCSVSCNAGFYACCNTTGGCHCV